MNETDAIRYRREAKHMYELGEWDWWVMPDGRVLHSAEVEYDPTMEVAGYGKTACGRSGYLSIPGIFTRMGAMRCVRCCRALRFPEGKGSPKNDKACRPLVKQRLKAVR